jgi:predicted  nucleic acid-binding Zn-ribbon protein
VLEDKQLEAMIALEDAESDHLTAKNRQTSALQRNEQRNGLLANEQNKLHRDIERLQGERVATLIGIPESDITLYDRLRSQRGGLAVARISDRSCSACGSTLSSALLNSAQLPNQISQCSRCNRILYAG